MIEKIAKMIDHSILHPTLSDQDLKRECDLAAKYEVATVCVKPYHVKMATKFLKGTKVKICSVIDFPHGNSSIEIKKEETLQVIRDGATEVDMVVNIGKVLQHDWNYINEELKEINSICLTKNALLKVIFETDFLTRDEDKIKLCQLCNNNDVGYVKTSTGFGFVKNHKGQYAYEGATKHDVTLMREHCNPKVKVKASGGIRDLNKVILMKELGVERIGATATKAIIEEAKLKFS